MDESMPETQPSGALTPPPTNPPTAVATSAPLPPRESTSRAVPYRRKGVRGLVDAALDGLDMLADRIANAANLR
jgi:hypothetical protein